MQGTDATLGRRAPLDQERDMRRPNTISKRTRSQRGMSILETTVASVILAVGIVSLTSVAATSARLHQSGVMKAAALRSLEAQIAVIESTAFAALPALDGTPFDVDASVQPPGGGINGPPPAGAIAVTAPTGNAAQLLEVTLTMSWRGMNGNQTMQRRLRRSRLGS
jgi:hypothetical protein